MTTIAAAEDLPTKDELWYNGKYLGGFFGCDLQWEIRELNGKKYQVCFGAGYIYEVPTEEE